jgi:hypothetical protein
MNLLGILTLIGVGLILAAVAGYLIAIALVLRQALKTLGSVNVGIRSIAERVEPLEPALSEIASDLSRVRDLFNRIVQEHIKEIKAEKGAV